MNGEDDKAPAGETLPVQTSNDGKGKKTWPQVTKALKAIPGLITGQAALAEGQQQILRRLDEQAAGQKSPLTPPSLSREPPDGSGKSTDLPPNSEPPSMQDTKPEEPLKNKESRSRRARL